MNLFDIFMKTPTKNYVVICHRKWKAAGEIKRETVLGKRATDKEWTTHDDAGRDCWWEGVNEKEGRNWSDTTVEAWEEISLSNDQDEKSPTK
jgi:hypothetical protein